MPNPAWQLDYRIARMAYLANDHIRSPTLCLFIVPSPHECPSTLPASHAFPYLTFSDLYLSLLLSTTRCHSLSNPFKSSVTYPTSIMTCRVPYVIILFALQFQLQSLFSLVYFLNYQWFISFQTWWSTLLFTIQFSSCSRGMKCTAHSIVFSHTIQSFFFCLL